MRRKSKGQTIVVIALVMPVLLGAIALGTDVAIFYFNWVQLQKAADAAVLAGANYLPDNSTQAITTANQYAQSDGAKAAEITSTTVTPDDLTITINLHRTVPYYFAKVLGLSNGTVAVTASAGPPYAPTTVNASSPGQAASIGDTNGTVGNYCDSSGTNISSGGVGGCGLIPIGLDSNTVYKNGNSITLQQGQVGPGNWDLLALGGVGGNNLRTRIADGYGGMVSVNDWVTTEPGQKVGPVDQGFQDRLALAMTTDPTGTFLNHSLNNPRVLVVPVVNWEGQNGRKQVQVTAFATLWLDSYSGGNVTVHFISQVVADSFGSPGATSFGGRGVPFLKN
ncbi:MAG TPA: pilus assembly protein TadG-related protein [Candidatus Binataceae bacterium]|nr:pilus assembly protein TadG-related protein [Candidatus Binataceae bacterium]